MLFRVIAGIVTVASIFVLWDQYLDEAELDISGMTPAEIDAAKPIVLWILVVLASASVLMYIVLVLLVIRGSNWARITTMAFGSIVIIASAIDYFDGGSQITLKTNLFGLSLDILVLIALSSQSARKWSRLPHGRKYRRLLAAQGVATQTQSQPTA